MFFQKIPCFSKKSYGVFRQGKLLDKKVFTQKKAAILCL
jgi:hypothetical protein